MQFQKWNSNQQQVPVKFGPTEGDVVTKGVQQDVKVSLMRLSWLFATMLEGSGLHDGMLRLAERREEMSIRR